MCVCVYKIYFMKNRLNKYHTDRKPYYKTKNSKIFIFTLNEYLSFKKKYLQ